MIRKQDAVKLFLAIIALLFIGSLAACETEEYEEHEHGHEGHFEGGEHFRGGY